MDGFETLEEIRKENSLPLLMFTSKNDSASKVRGLRAGADDYLTKPFDMDELIARIAVSYTHLNISCMRNTGGTLLSMTGADLPSRDISTTTATPLHSGMTVSYTHLSV